ncbi:MAG: hypothetical protein HY595_04245 [Candidatus Omnitrophica bacterium]|nr:hypothetical protein [Candidatus Omnitrophota bacterium]
MKSHIPHFKSLNEEREFWQTHSVTEFEDELTPVKVRFVSPRKKSTSITLTGVEIRVLQGVLARLTNERRAPLFSHRKRGAL